MWFKYLLAIVFFSQIINIQAQNKQDRNFGNNKQTAPDVCLVQAKIVKIVPARKKISKKSCKTAPCLATIEILKIEKTGRTFPEKFTTGQKINIKFSCSLKENENKKLPGLKKKDSFKAEIIAKPKKGTNSIEYIINSYQKM